VVYENKLVTGNGMKWKVRAVAGSGASLIYARKYYLAESRKTWWGDFLQMVKLLPPWKLIFFFFSPISWKSFQISKLSGEPPGGA